MGGEAEFASGAAARHPLERLLAPLDPLPLDDPSWSPHPRAEPAQISCYVGNCEWQWLRDGDWHIFARPGPTPGAGRPIRSFLAADGRLLTSHRNERGEIVVPFGLADAYLGYTTEMWARRAAGRSLPSPALNAYYRVKGAIPRPVQLAARRALIRWQGSPSFPQWPFDHSVDTLLRFYVRCALEARGGRTLDFRWFWPRHARAALILTHDVESADGLRNAVRVADLEQERGLRSSFNVVADAYPIDWGVIEELQRRGFEIGVHGIHHDRSMFSSRQEFDRQQPRVREMADRVGAQGFRSPATHRMNDWLAHLPIEYDCTVPISDPYEPQPGGCCSPWPFFYGNVIELPYTLPQDHTTFTLLGERTIGLWLRQLESIERSAGIAQCVSHPDPGYLGDPAKEALYCEFLDAVAERPGLWRALPREAAAWWRRRDADWSARDRNRGIAELGDDGSVELRPARSREDGVSSVGLYRPARS